MMAIVVLDIALPIRETKPRTA